MEIMLLILQMKSSIYLLLFRRKTNLINMDNLCKDLLRRYNLRF